MSINYPSLVFYYQCDRCGDKHKGLIYQTTDELGELILKVPTPSQLITVKNKNEYTFICGYDPTPKV